MTRYPKIAISLPPGQLEEARALAAVAPVPEPEGDTLANLVTDLIAEHGRPSAEAYAWADRVLAMSDPD